MKRRVALASVAALALLGFSGVALAVDYHQSYEGGAVYVSAAAPPTSGSPVTLPSYSKGEAGGLGAPGSSFESQSGPQTFVERATTTSDPRGGGALVRPRGGAFFSPRQRADQAIGRMIRRLN